jgi:hypothetical protein
MMGDFEGPLLHPRAELVGTSDEQNTAEGLRLSRVPSEYVIIRERKLA